MPTRTSPKSWGALCLGMLLMSAVSSAARADGTTSTGTTDTSTGTTGTTAAPTTTYYDCPPESRWRGFWRRGSSRFGNRYPGSPLRSYVPADQTYCDPRDQLLYSAQGYNVPVTVPLAPVCRIYNYGWGVPSARLSRAGAYSQWYPDVAFTQTRGRLPGGVYPMVYQPTDTTQAGVYYQYVPTWVSRPIP